MSEKWAVGIVGCRNSGLTPYIFIGAILNIGHGWNYVILFVVDELADGR